MVSLLGEEEGFYMRTVVQPVPGLHPMAADYGKNLEKLKPFYHFYPRDSVSTFHRMEWLDQSDKLRVNRDRIADALLAYNRTVGAGEKTLQHIAELRDKKAVCVIGGQQAGLMAGPMYTVYKAISIIQWAHQERQRTSRPVIPIFWIAGEDHDWEEVNHLYMKDKHGQPVKIKWPKTDYRRLSISHHVIDQADATAFIDQVFELIPDSLCKMEIKAKLMEAASSSTTFADFFARWMVWLFKEEGLVVVDAADPVIRQLEAPFFEKLIIHNEDLHRTVELQSDGLVKAGYAPAVALEPDDAHLFIYENDERLLLKRDGKNFSTKNGGYRYTREELLFIAQSQPERLSTNVFFRTLMQEYLFPTLHTVLGPSEVAYWGMFGAAFERLHMKMPVIQPRFGVTLVESYEKKWMEHYGIEFVQIPEGLQKWEDQILLEAGSEHWKYEFRKVRQAFLQTYEPLIHKIVEQDPGLSGLAASNMEKIIGQIGFLEQKVDQSLVRVKDTELHRLDRIQASIWPLGRPQERVYPLVYYLSRYGMDGWKQMKQYPWNLSAPHHLVYL